VDEEKIEAIKSWPILATLTQLRSFLGLAGFYRCFMRDLSTIAAPLNDLMKKGVSFHWGAVQEQDFHTLIDKLTHAPLNEFKDFVLIWWNELAIHGLQPHTRDGLKIAMC
jgi:hypothetical protein